MKKILSILVMLVSIQSLGAVQKTIDIQNMSGNTVSFCIVPLLNLDVDPEVKQKKIILGPYETKHITLNIKKDDSLVDIYVDTKNDEPICECSAREKIDRSLPMSMADILPNLQSPMRCVVTADHEALTIQE